MMQIHNLTDAEWDQHVGDLDPDEAVKKVVSLFPFTAGVIVLTRDQALGLNRILIHGDDWERYGDD